MISRTARTRLFRELALSRKLIAEWHPRQLVEELVTRRGRDLVFTYSRYEVAEPGLQATAPRSDVLRVPASDVTSSWLADRFAALGPNEEMAWHSWVECKGVGFHIPMIDFIGHPDPSELSQLSKVLAARMGLKGHFVFFETGRSFHGYFPDLIAEGALPKYLGQLLLLNKHDRPELIDTRWVGHALVRGFTALRWSHNTNRYRGMPRLASVLHAEKR